MPPNTIAVSPEFDNGGVASRIALLVLDTAETSERDLRFILPPSAQFYTARIKSAQPVTVENLRSLATQIAPALERILPGARIDAVCFDCTSGTLAAGYDVIQREVQRVRPDIPVITPMTASLHALEAVGARKVSVLTPYPQEVNATLSQHLQTNGVEVLSMASFLLDDDIAMARLTPESITRAAVSTCEPDADALFVSCTAIRAAEVITHIEAQLGRPVITAVQAMAWDCLRSTGHMGSIDGYGQLLQTPTYEFSDIQEATANGPQ